MQKASTQLHEISRLHSYLGFKEKETIINSFMLILVTVLWYDIFAEPSLLGKLKKYKKVRLKSYIITLKVIRTVF